MFTTPTGYNTPAIIRVFEIDIKVYRDLNLHILNQSLKRFMMSLHHWSERQFEEYYIVYQMTQN